MTATKSLEILEQEFETAKAEVERLELEWRIISAQNRETIAAGGPAAQEAAQESRNAHQAYRSYRMGTYGAARNAFLAARVRANG